MKAMGGSIGGAGRAVARLATGLALLLVLVACGGERAPATSAAGSGAPEGAGGAGVPGTAGDAAPARSLDPARAGRITGVVRLDGPAPSRPPLPVVGEAWCAAQHPGGAVPDGSLRVAGGRVAEAFVWIVGDLDGWELAPPGEPVVLDQQQCLFVPRVVGVMLGQELQARNGDGVMHNVHTRPEDNKPQNFGMPAGAAPRPLRFRRPEVMVEVVCDVHAWMRAWIGVLPHPCFAVSGEDGAFAVEGVPPGEHVLGVWHEVLGEQRLPVVVPEGGELALGEVLFRP